MEDFTFIPKQTEQILTIKRVRMVNRCLRKEKFSPIEDYVISQQNEVINKLITEEKPTKKITPKIISASRKML